jgi:hypothetical protein
VVKTCDGGERTVEVGPLRSSTVERDVVLGGFNEGYGLALIIGRLMEGRGLVHIPRSCAGSCREGGI